MYVRHLEITTSFKYLGQVISAADDYWSTVFRNLDKAQAVWRRLTRILIREGAAPRLFGFFFNARVQTVLLFGAETRVVTPRMGPVLGEFQNQVAQPLTGRIMQRRTARKW